MTDTEKYLQEISETLRKSTPLAKEVEEYIGKSITHDINTEAGKAEYETWEYKDYDLNEDGKITKEDVTLAKANEKSILQILSSLPSAISDALSKNEYTNKDMYIKYVAARIFSNSDFDRHSTNTLLKRAVDNATLLANKLFKK